MGTNGRPEKDFEHITGTSRRSHQEDIPGNSEVGRDFANRYGGLFSEKDWKCPTCSNINWARRTECNQCKTSKPGLETSLGTREGRGGGFLERDEVVEYKQSRNAEKDDEWDEFGRKRKKKKNSNYNNRYNNNYDDDDEYDYDVNYDRTITKEKRAAKEEEKYDYEKPKVKSKSKELIKEKKNEEDEEEGDDDDRWAAWDDIIGSDNKGENNSIDNNYNNSGIDGRDNVKSHNERSSPSSKEHWSGKYSRRRSSRSQSPLPPLSSYYNDHSLSRDRNSRKNRSISREHRSSGQSSSWDNHGNKRRSSIIDVNHRHRSKSRSRERKRNSHGSKSRSTSRNRKRSYRYRSCSRSRSPPGRQYQNRSLSRSKSSERRY